MSEPDPHIEVPYELRAGTWADAVDVFGDIENATLDSVRFDPRDPGLGFVVLQRWREEIRKRAYERLRERNTR